MTTILDYEHQFILEEDAARRLAAEGRFDVPGCPWGCDGSGWRAVEKDEDQVPRPLEVVIDRTLYTPCECNCRLVWRDGRYQTEVRRRGAAVAGVGDIGFIVGRRTENIYHAAIQSRFGTRQ